jgi:Tol biopolymer transport system component
LTKKYKDIFTVKWSNKTGRIVFCGNQNLYVMDSSGGGLKKIFSRGGFPNIHSDGQKVIFVGYDKDFTICEIDLKGENLKILEKIPWPKESKKK